MKFLFLKVAMHYLKIGMIFWLLTASLIGMQKPYFRGDNKIVQMWVPCGWRDNQLRHGESVRFCADLNNYKDIDIITKDLKMSSEVVEESLKSIITQLGFAHVLNNYRQDRLGGNVLYVKTDNIYMATDWYMVVKYYYFGHHHKNTIRLASLIGLYNQDVLLVPVSITHEEGNKKHKTSLNEAQIIYFEPQDYDIQCSGKYEKMNETV